MTQAEHQTKDVLDRSGQIKGEGKARRGGVRLVFRPGLGNGLEPGISLATALAGRLLDALLPPQCLSCATPVAEPGNLCGACWEQVTFLGAPQCAACGQPFAFDPGPDVLCGACHRNRPRIDRARSVVQYNDASKPMVLAFKHADRTDSAPAFARWMVRAAPRLVSEADLIVPVPLHWTRLWRRRFNQAALLAKRLGALSGTPVDGLALKRKKRTQSQGHLTRSQRRRNVAGAFQVASHAKARLCGKRILLIDDVMTTGATADACAKALLAAGARAVDLLTLARVVRPS